MAEMMQFPVSFHGQEVNKVDRKAGGGWESRPAVGKQVAVEEEQWKQKGNRSGEKEMPGMRMKPVLTRPRGC